MVFLLLPMGVDVYQKLLVKRGAWSLNLPLSLFLLLCRRSYGVHRALRPGPFRCRSPAPLTAPSGFADYIRYDFQKSRPCGSATLETNGRTQVGHLDGILFQLRWHVRRLQRGAGDRSDSAGRRVHPRLSATPGGGGAGTRPAAAENYGRRTADTHYFPYGRGCSRNDRTNSCRWGD